MIRILCCCAMLLALSLPGAEPWGDPAAAFRVLLRREAADKEGAASFVVSDYLLPDSLSNGAKALLPGGGSVALERDESGRALIFPACGDAREFYLYGGYAEPQPLPKSADGGKKYNMLTMEEVVSWRLPGNFREYLERRSRDLQRRSRNQYDNMLRQFTRHTLSSFLMPPETGRHIPANVWEINSILANENPDLFHFDLYRSRGLTRGADWRFFQRFPMKAFFPDRNFYKNRLWWEVDSFGRQRERNEKDWNDALATDREKLIFGEVTERFSSRLNDRSPAPRFPAQLRIVSRELDLNGSAVLRYSGHLDIGAAGTYEFEVETNALWIMEINGEPAARKALDPDLSKEHRFRFSKELTPGLVPFTFYYARCESPQDFTVRMKAPGGEWAVLGDDAFAPAMPCEVGGIEMRDGRSFPVIRRYREGCFMTGKQSFRQLERLELPEETALLRGERELALPSVWAALSGEKSDDALRIRHRGNLFELPSVDPAVSPVVLKGALSMELRVPPTVYDDENAVATVVIHNDYPQTVPLYLVSTVGTGTDAPQETVETISAAPGITLHEIALEIRDGAVDVELAVPGFVFGSGGVRVVPANRLPETPVVAHDRLMEPETNRACCVVIHRMALSDLRTWELPRLLNSRAPRSLLVLGEGEALPELIARRWPDGVVNLEIRAWPSESVKGESRLLRGLGGALERLRSEKFDGVLLIPPASDMPLLGTEAFCRYLAIVADAARDSGMVRQIFMIASPDDGRDRNPRLIRFAREYGFELL